MGELPKPPGALRLDGSLGRKVQLFLVVPFA
jgi:hypothetical protein